MEEDSRVRFVELRAHVMVGFTTLGCSVQSLSIREVLLAMRMYDASAIAWMQRGGEFLVLVAFAGPPSVVALKEVLISWMYLFSCAGVISTVI